MVTIRDVAKRAGVSVAAVSRALNDYPDINAETKRKILCVVKEMRYYPNASARHLVTRRTRMIGVYYRASEGFRHLFLGHVLNVFKNAIGEAGYDMMVFANTRKPFEKWGLLDRVQHRDVDGLLIVGAPDEEISGLLEDDIPLVVVDYVVPGRNTGSVTSENRRSIHEAVLTFYRQGFRRIGFVHGPLHIVTAMERLQGFYSGMGEVGLEINTDWIFRADFSLEGGMRAGCELVGRRDWPELVLCSSDVDAIGVMHMIQKSGMRIPQDISIVGFDDIEASKYVYPPLTTIAQDKEGMGKKAASILIEMIEGQGGSGSVTAPMHSVLPTRLVLRGTTRLPDSGEGESIESV